MYKMVQKLIAREIVLIGALLYREEKVVSTMY